MGRIAREQSRAMLPLARPERDPPDKKSQVTTQ
jgi:hypothetical protein